MKNKLFDKAIRFQEKELEKYSNLSFADIGKLPQRTEIESPAGLEEFDFALTVASDEFGGLEVNLFHYRSDHFEIPSYIKDALGDDEISIGERRQCRWFNILPNGVVDWPSFEHLDGED